MWRLSLVGYYLLWSEIKHLQKWSDLSVCVKKNLGGIAYQTFLIKEPKIVKLF